MIFWLVQLIAFWVALTMTVAWAQNLITWVSDKAVPKPLDFIGIQTVAIP